MSIEGLDDQVGIVLLKVGISNIEIAVVNKVFSAMVGEEDHKLLIGQSLNKYMPTNIAAVHDQCVRNFLQAGADILLRKNEIQSCLVTADGSCRQLRLFVKLEIHDANYVYISGVIASSHDILHVILTDKAGVIQLIDQDVSSSIFPQTKIDLNEEPVIGLTIPGVHQKVIKPLESEEADVRENITVSRQ